MSEPYRVDTTWTVVRKDASGEDISFAQSWGDLEFVQKLVEYLNDAWKSGYDAGRDAAREEGPTG